MIKTAHYVNFRKTNKMIEKLKKLVKYKTVDKRKLQHVK